MSLQSVTVRGNSTRANTTPLGGGILNGGTMTILDSTISSNSTTTVAPTASAIGGGVLNSGSLTVRNSTISGNTAGGNVGGGIHHTPYALNLALTHVTVTDNSSGGDGGGLSLQGGAVTVVNSIIAGNRVPRGMGGPDCSAGPAALLTFDYNLVGNTRYCAPPAGAVGNVLDRPARLQALGHNGGPTETHALLPSSPAIHVGSNASCVPTDQRGQPRPVDANRDGVAPRHGLVRTGSLTICACPRENPGSRQASARVPAKCPAANCLRGFSTLQPWWRPRRDPSLWRPEFRGRVYRAAARRRPQPQTHALAARWLLRVQRAFEPLLEHGLDLRPAQHQTTTSSDVEGIGGVHRGKGGSVRFRPRCREVVCHLLDLGSTARCRGSRWWRLPRRNWTATSRRNRCDVRPRSCCISHRAETCRRNLPVVLSADD